MKILSLLILLIAANVFGASGVRYSEYAKTNSLPPSGLLLISLQGNTNVSIYGSNLINQLSFANSNGFNFVNQQISSTNLINAIDVVNGASYYYWTNMVTNITLNITNSMQLGSFTNRTLNFFFTGATNNGPNYTVTFACPVPSGLVFRWGINSATNGSTSTFTVTNNCAVGASLTLWSSNLVEAFYQTTR